MSDKILRYLAAAVIAMLLIHQIGALVFDVFGMAWGIVSAVVVAVVSFVSARLAKTGGKSSLWFLMPTLIFTVIPIVATVWNAITGETGMFDRLVNLTPFIMGFAAPVILLLLMYLELRKRTMNA